MPAVVQNWTTDELGRWGAAPERLSSKVRNEAMATMVLNQFAIKEEKFGANKGDTLTFNIYSDIKETGRRVLGEFEEIPIGHQEIARVKLVVQEGGYGLAYTGKANLLSEIGPRDQCVKALRRDHSKYVDGEVYLEMDKCAAKFVATSATAGVMYQNGTAGTACLANLNTTHVDFIVDYLKENNCPRSNSNFWSVVSIRAARGVKTDLKDIRKYTSYDELARGEIGRYEDVRFVEETNSLSGRIGTGSVAGEAFFFGPRPVMRGRVLPMQIRSKTGSDFGRNPALAWYCLEGYKEINPADSTIPQRHCVKFDSSV